ncbi:methylated-DNA-[protein]-cysteine S-methyltransferase [Desulfatibacillum alkenivorans DSM 16219]|uniref:methylated-DNA--[protein]-cysteine S-methyltransferase n=1 Tax=Desulfatibacillum alkenivorans DSM 16219 TaxID=1121393 RepID=A0A1M6KMM4_9BACT|nr:methylated-DNA--[protein]-cysteine S-methyltransferase [Desulfatibacillum alkenivorans]SHJ60146.1 methylated-DNA-[protein]-cysteine S-methyltransferase [Desulfatibacillum alkenivorans DSM 16219]
MKKNDAVFFMEVETSHGMAGFVYQNAPFALLKTYLPKLKKAQLPKEVQAMKVEPSPAQKARELAQKIKDYFEGSPLDPHLDLLDFEGLTELQIKVLRTVAAIPYGQVCSYGEVARRAGCPRAARFVGSVMAGNPFPMFVPCHRVVRSDGKLGGFGGGLPLKETMLAVESGKHLAGKQGV